MRGGRKWHTHMAVEAQLERDHLLIAALSLSGIGLTLLENELLRLNGGEPSSSCEALKLLCSALTGCQIFSIGHFYRRRFHHLKTTNTLLREDTLQSSGLFSCALVEICAALVHAPEVAQMIGGATTAAAIAPLPSTDERTGFLS